MLRLARKLPRELYLGVAEFAVDLLKLRASKKTVSPYEMSIV